MFESEKHKYLLKENVFHVVQGHHLPIQNPTSLIAVTSA